MESCRDRRVLLFFFKVSPLVLAARWPSAVEVVSTAAVFVLNLTFSQILGDFKCFRFCFKSNVFLAACIPCLTDVVILGVDLSTFVAFVNGAAREHAYA